MYSKSLSITAKLKTVHCLVAIVCLALAAPGESRGAEPGEERMLPTHAEAALIFAKHSGLFDRYVRQDASVNECVSFLNEHGVYFGLFEVIEGADFTLEDCARVMGQLHLLFAGEAAFVAGKIKLPMGIDSWVAFCMLNNIRYVQAYQNVVGMAGVLRGY